MKRIKSDSIVAVGMFAVVLMIIYMLLQLGRHWGHLETAASRGDVIEEIHAEFKDSVDRGGVFWFGKTRCIPRSDKAVTLCKKEAAQ